MSYFVRHVRHTQGDSENKEILYMQFRTVYHPSHSETLKLLHLLKVGSLVLLMLLVPTNAVW